MSDTPRPSRPEFIGRYRVTSRIGRGAMGAVYAAHDDVMGRDVAIKVMMADLEEDPDIRARFVREAQVAARLAHRNIVTILDIGEENGRLFIVMELLRGQTLTDCLNQRTMPLEEKVDLILEVCEGLAVASAGGVCHRDIKPGNLFVLSDGGIKILDFGIARLASSNMTASGFIVGTPDYMSPEQARGVEIDERSDIFSVGAVLYQMLTGRKPFLAPDLPAVLHKVVSQDPPPIDPSEAPAALSRIVFKALAKHPAQRFQRFPELSLELTRWRRRHEAETRTQAADAARAMGELRGLADSERSAADILSVRSEADLSTALAEISAGYDALASKGPDALRSGLWMRVDVETIGARIQRITAAWEARIATLRAAGIDLALAKGHLERGDPQAALAGLQSVVRQVPSAGIQSLIERAQGDLAGVRGRDERLRRVLGEAADALARRKLDSALALAREATQVHPGSAEARHLLAQVEHELANSEAENGRRCREYLDRARRALDLDQVETAEQQLRLANETGSIDPDLAGVSAAVTAARQARDLADAAIREVASELARARQDFHTNDRVAAIARLDALSARNPSSIAVRANAARLRAEHERLTAVERVQGDAARLADAAANALARGDDVAAARLAHEALALLPGLELALETSASAKARARETAERTQREERARRLVESAEGLLARGRYERAIRAARRAADLTSASTAAVDLIMQAVRRQADEAAETKKKKDSAQQAADIREVLGLATRALRAQEFGRARLLAEEGLLLDPANASARDLRAKIAAAAALAAGEEGAVDFGIDREEAEATVLLSAGPHRGPATWSRVLTLWAAHLWRSGMTWVRLRWQPRQEP